MGSPPELRPKRAQQKAKAIILEEEYGRLLEHERRKDRRTKATSVAGAILEPVNKRLKDLGLNPYKENSLRKALRPFIAKQRQARAPSSERANGASDFGTTGKTLQTAHCSIGICAFSSQQRECVAFENVRFRCPTKLQPQTR